MIIILAENRCKIGKKFSRRIRRVEKKIPAIIYGKGKPSIPIELDQNIIFNLQCLKKFYSSKICLKFNKNLDILVKIKSIQKHAFKLKIIHIDFIYI